MSTTTKATAAFTGRARDGLVQIAVTYDGHTLTGYVDPLNESVTLPPGFVFHDLRKTFGTHVLRATNDLTVVQRLLGHSSPAVTEAVYIGEDMDLRTAPFEGLER
jgi:integrase